VEATNLVIS
jgi:hypothetical protein